MKNPLVVLKPKRNASLLRKHPWVFSGAIEKIILPDDFPSDKSLEGETVVVGNQAEEVLGVGHFSEGSIAIRLLCFENKKIDLRFWEEKIQKAFDYRKRIGLTENKSTNCYRLIHAEGDELPGLIIDIYETTAVIQAHSTGMIRAVDLIAKALMKVVPTLKAVYNKSEKSLQGTSDEKFTDGFIIGKDSVPKVVLENKLKFEVDWISGQKTGFFLDQRDNRALLQNFVKNKKVLNTFCYSGGFSIYALAAGADLVHSVDSSAKAIALTNNNVALNFEEHTNHKAFESDTLDFLKSNDENYDVIVLDPPAYAKSRKSMHRAVQGYKRLNSLALSKINPGGILFTFSCSQVISTQLFLDTVTAAAIEANRNVKIIHRLNQGADHPTNIFHPEGDYLKGLVLFIES